MQVRHFHLQKTEEAPPCVLALGLFDGVHVGHRALLDEAYGGVPQTADLAGHRGLRFRSLPSIPPAAN